MKGSFIKKLRLEMQMTQIDFADSLSISQAYVSVLEAGVKDLSFDIAYRIKNLARKKGIKITLEQLRPDYIDKKKRINKNSCAEDDKIGDEHACYDDNS